MLVNSCQAPGKSCQHLIFCFPGKTEPKNFAEKPMQLASTFFFIFLSSSLTFPSSSQQLQKCAKDQMFLTPCWSVTFLGLFFKNLYDFSANKLSSAEPTYWKI